ncbi:MAG: tRNA hydroxylase [Planctomycetes bacterium]|nr:tRNA hydroxylase [Planctomycetota bacterium]
MLSLRSTTDPAWVARIEPDMAEVLVDHAHCEKKAAGTAMNMVFSYVEHPAFIQPLTEVVEEELQHFRAVLGIMASRDVKMTGQVQSSYGKRLGALIRTREPEKALDRCCVAALIEARSCERFILLSEHLQDRELGAFYGELLESEARHHALYLRLAEHFVPRETMRSRLEELAAAEAEIIALGDPLPRLHS